MSSGANQLVIMADEHMASAMGCAGHELVRTPNLDALADRGTVFDNAYTPSPMCVPARAAFQTGRHVHQVRCWDSAEPYTGKPAGWGHLLRAAGRRVVSVGKLHYRSSRDDNGFAPELLPLHVLDGVGWAPGLLRRRPMPFDASGFAGGIGSAGSAYTDYDRRICDAACAWLRESGGDDGKGPWVLFVSFVSPHYPLSPPAAFAALYDPRRMDLPHGYAAGRRPAHPAVRHIIDAAGYDRHFVDEAQVRRARAAYYALCSYVDALVGELLATLQLCGCADRSCVLFTSDHGEMLGNHGTWTKMLMYEDSVRVPLILAGPEVARGHRVCTPVSLVDVAPTLAQCAGVTPPLDAGFAGRSLLELAGAPDGRERTAFSEYHDGWSASGCFMVRWGRWKYVHYEGFAPQLFDLEADPREHDDLGESLEHGAPRAEGDRRLRAIVDPAVADARAFADQAGAIARLGGEEAIRAQMERYFDYTPLSVEAAPAPRS